MATNIFGTLFAAISFSGANLLFKYLDPSDYSKESKKHNEAMKKSERHASSFFISSIISKLLSLSFLIIFLMSSGKILFKFFSFSSCSSRGCATSF